MKKILVIILALTLAFSMCACEEVDKLKSIDLPPLPNTTEDLITDAPPQETEPAETPDAVSPEPTSTASEELSNPVMVNIKGTTHQEYDPAEGTELILTFAYETPSVYIEGRDTAAGAINNYISLLDETYYTGNDHGVGTAVGFNMMLELAQDNYGYVVGTGAEGISLEFAASRTVVVERADSKLLSLVYNDYVYQGGAHGNYFDRGYVFDTETGEKLSLDKLTTDFDAFSAFAVKYMVEKAESDPYYAERIDASLVPVEQYSAAFGALLREGSWYFDSEGLVIFSDLYELSSYAAGMIEFTIPYSELKGVIDDKWIPAVRNGEGEFSVKPISEVEGGDTAIIDKLTANSEGEELALVVSGTVYDVSVSRVEYVDKFFETVQLWHCSYMTDSALQLCTTVPEGMPNLMISYRTGSGEVHRLLLTQNGNDGGIVLVDDSIEAVG